MQEKLQHNLVLESSISNCDEAELSETNEAIKKPAYPKFK